MLRVIIALLCWFVVLTIGMTVNSSHLEPSPLGIVLFVASSTVTNVGLLAVTASLVRVGDDWKKSVQRGFTIYLMLISGTVVVFTDSITNPTPEQYGKIAGMVSLICILTSYRPELFDSFMDRMSTVVTGPQRQDV